MIPQNHPLDSLKTLYCFGDRVLIPAQAAHHNEMMSPTVTE
jgi:hypothetical protein